MHLHLDQYAHLDSSLHRWDQRYKIAAFLALIFAFSYVRDFRILPAMVAVSAIIFIASRLPLAFLLERLRLPSLFLLLLVIILPLFSGQTVLFDLGPLAVKEEGCRELLSIAVRFFCILTMGIVLFGTASFINNIRAMQAMGLPPILSDMVLFSYRYLFDIAGILRTMQTAMRLRGLREKRLKSISTFASLAGSILVRSYEQSDRVYHAMILRGYGQPQNPQIQQGHFKTYSPNRGWFLSLLLVAAALIAAELYFN